MTKASTFTVDCPNREGRRDWMGLREGETPRWIANGVHVWYLPAKRQPVASYVSELNAEWPPALHLQSGGREDPVELAPDRRVRDESLPSPARAAGIYCMRR